MLPTRVLYYGKDEPLPERLPLRAGPLTLVWENGDLRYIKMGDVEVVRGSTSRSVTATGAPRRTRCRTS